MVVLVAYATRHGATAGIAERIAAGLCRSGIDAEALPVNAVHDVRAYDAVVLGGAAYLFHWHKDAADFARSYRVALRERPVWLFSSGPLGTDLVDQDGAEVLQTCRPLEFQELSVLVRARGTEVLFGDFRDWPTIDAWANQIAAALTCPHTGVQSSQSRVGARRHAPRLDA